MGEAAEKAGPRAVNPAAVRPARGRWTHLLNGPTTTVCERPVNPERWTVIAHSRVHDSDWCETCWNRHFNQSTE